MYFMYFLMYFCRLFSVFTDTVHGCRNRQVKNSCRNSGMIDRNSNFASRPYSFDSSLHTPPRTPDFQPACFRILCFPNPYLSDPLRSADCSGDRDHHSLVDWHSGLVKYFRLTFGGRVDLISAKNVVCDGQICAISRTCCAVMVDHLFALSLVDGGTN